MPATVTFGPDGGVQSVTVTEPRFTPDEVDLLLAARRDERVPRGSHGFTIEEATDSANQFAFVGEDPIEDYAQLAIDQKREAYRAKYPDANMSSKLFRAKKRD